MHCGRNQFTGTQHKRLKFFILSSGEAKDLSQHELWTPRNFVNWCPPRFQLPEHENKAGCATLWKKTGVSHLSQHAYNTEYQDAYEMTPKQPGSVGPAKLRSYFLNNLGNHGLKNFSPRSTSDTLTRMGDDAFRHLVITHCRIIFEIQWKSMPPSFFSCGEVHYNGYPWIQCFLA